MLFAGWEGRIVKNCDRGLYFDDFFLRERTYHPLRRKM